MAHHRADDAGLRGGLQALHPEHADSLDLRRQQHVLRHAVHARRSVRAGAERPCTRRLSLQLDAARGRRRRSIFVLYIALLPAGNRGPRLRRLRLRRAFVADRGTFDRDGGRPADLLLQIGHSAGRRPGDASGRRRDRALHRLPQDRTMAEPTQGRRGDRRGGGTTRASEYVDEATRNAAIERAQKIDEQARQRGMGGDL